MPDNAAARKIPRFQPDFSGTESARLLAECDAADRDVSTDDPDFHCRLWATRAAAQVASDPSAAAEAADHSRRWARSSSDPATKGYAMLARSFVDLGPDTAATRHHWAQQAVEAALQSGDAQLAEYAYFLLLGTATEQSDIPALDLALSGKSKVVKAFPHLRHGRHAVWFRCMRATLDGRMERAHALADEGYALASAAQDPDAAMVWAGQIAVIRWLQGDDDQIEPFLQEARQAYPGEYVWAAALARLWLRQDRPDAARGVLDSLPDLDDLTRDRNWLAAMAILAEVAAEIGTTEFVTRLRDILTPFAPYLVTIGLGVAAWGTVTQALALLERRLGDTAAAEDHLHAAQSLCSRLSSQTWLAQAQCELASILHERRDDSAAAALASQSAVTARLLGMRPTHDRAQRLIGSLTTSAQRDVVRGITPGPEPTSAEIQVLGDFRVTAADGTEAHWRSAKAKELLGILIARRGAPLSRERLLDILWPDVAPHLLRNRAAVAISTVRRALDPQRRFDRNHFVYLDASIVRLETERIAIDAETFLRTAESTLHQTTESGPDDPDAADVRFARLRALIESWPGPAFPSYVDEEWAESYRRVVHSFFGSTAHTLARLAAERDDHLLRVDTYRALIEVDPYDRQAHEGLVQALDAMGAARQADLARSEAERLHIEIDPPEAS